MSDEYKVTAKKKAPWREGQPIPLPADARVSEPIDGPGPGADATGKEHPEQEATAEVMERNRTAMVVAFFGAAFVIVVTVTGARLLANGAETQLKVNLIATSLGALVALLAAVLLLFRAAEGTRSAELQPLLLPLLAGALISSGHWGVAAAIAGLGVTLTIREMVGTPADRRGSRTPGGPPPERSD